MKNGIKIFAVLIIMCIAVAGIYFFVAHFGVAKSKISVDIQASNKIQEELKTELIDAQSTNIMEVVTGQEVPNVTVIVSAIDVDQLQNTVAKIEEINAAIVTMSPADLVNLSKDSNIKYLYKDDVAKIDSTMELSLQFLHTTPESSSAGIGSKVCILDTGIDSSHPWFKGKTIHEMYFLYGEESSGAEDDNGHGTHVAGIVTSVAPGAELYIGKVCNSGGSCMFSDIMRAIDWCKENDVDVISMSLGAIRYPMACDNYMISQQINTITEENDILVTAAAGNVDCADCADYEVALPGCASKAISVSAIDIVSKDRIYNPAGYDMFNSATICEDDGTSCYQYDPGFSMIDIIANGYVESAWPGGKTVSLHGTSMATPHVAGAIALLKSINHDSSETIRQYLYSGATKDGYPSNGLLNVANSCQQMLGETPVACSGYYSSIQLGSNTKWKSTDWLRLEMNGVEKRYRKSTTTTVAINYKINRSLDPVLDFYNKHSEYKKSEIRKIDNNIFVVTKKLGGKTVYEIHNFEINNEPGRYQGKRATITILREITDSSWNSLQKRMATEKSMNFYPLESCQSTSSRCSQYINEADNYIGSMKDLDFNNLEIVKSAQ